MTLSSMGRRFGPAVFQAPTPVKTFLGGTHVAGGPGTNVSGTYTIPNNALVLVGGYTRIGTGDTPRGGQVTVGATTLTVSSGSILDAPYVFVTAFHYAVIASGGSLTIEWTDTAHSSINAGQIRGFFVWTLENLPHPTPKTASSQINEGLVLGTPPSAAAVDAGDWAFAISERQNTTTDDFQPSTPPPDHDPTTSATYRDSAYGVCYAGDWVITSTGTLTCRGTNNTVNCQKSLITFATV